MLRKVRITFAVIFFTLITFLFLDFTGTLHLWFGWMARIQLIPAILAVNIAVIVGLIAVTLIFGRIYCSVICPLGIFQDGISNISARRKNKKRRFRYSPAKSWLRYAVLALFIFTLIMGISAVVSVLDPYAAYGRIASDFFSPLYRLGNNLLAFAAERVDSYVFYSTEVWVKGWITFAIAIVTLIATGVLAWCHGRTYCNTICPVGTFLGLLSKYSLFRISIAESKCSQCKACERNCKASCIDIKNMSIDHSRCVSCFNCIGKCKSGAIQYAPVKLTGKKEIQEEVVSGNSSDVENNTDGFSRRDMLTLLGTITVTGTVKAQQLQVDGGLADIKDKKNPERKTPVVPPGAQGLQNVKDHCTACQLCVSSCPNNILRPSGKLLTFMQPEMSFERGYCRPECVECSAVCPSKAIIPVTTAEKTSISIGQAVWIKDNCVVNTDNLQCNSCQRHCPTGAVSLVAINPEDEKSLKFPVISTGLCIGCGACEHYCPARPFSAIYVEGNVRHHTV
jgi:ferredoxin